MPMPASSFAIVPPSAASVAGLGTPPDGTSGIVRVTLPPTSGPLVVPLVFDGATGRWYSAPWPLLELTTVYAGDTAGAWVPIAEPYFTEGFVPHYRQAHAAGLRLEVLLTGVWVVGGAGIGTPEVRLELRQVNAGDVAAAALETSVPVAAGGSTPIFPADCGVWGGGLGASPSRDHVQVVANVRNTNAGSPITVGAFKALARWVGTP